MKNFLIMAFLSGLIFFNLNAQDRDYLKRSEIQKIMEQIFAQHLEKKVVSGEILKNSFKVYLEQFDPDGIYLLEGEVANATQLSPTDIQKIELDYKRGDFSSYDALNQLIQKAIARSHENRLEIEKYPQSVFEQSLAIPFVTEVGPLYSYPKTLEDLKVRQKKHLMGFLQREVKRFGEKGVKGYEPQAIALYERQMRENELAYVNPSLSDVEAENLFTLHVLKALAKSLDAHTAFFDSNEAYDMRVRLEKGFEGVGLVFQEAPQGIVVTHIIEGSPAAIQGEVKPQDVLLSIDGKEVKDQPFEKVMDLLRGKKGEAIQLTLKRQNGTEKNSKQFSVTLNRDTILLKENRVDVSSEQFGNGIIGKITLHSFYQNDKGITSEKDVRQALRELDKEGRLRGVILDLRENSGGFLSQAVKVAGLFITNGVVVVSKYANGDEKIYRDMDSHVAYKGPLIILTSKATASAAEIVAQTLQDYGVGVVVGDEQTYGKGTIQTQTVTDKRGGGSYFKVTVGTYYTVSGKTPQIQGVKADIVVPGPYASFHLGEEYLEQKVNNNALTIHPNYKDTLSDIDPSLKPWYLHYYTPSLQNRSSSWQAIIPELKKNSSYRIAHNKNYQLFLKKFNPEYAVNLKDQIQEEEVEKSSNFGVGDLQLAEAVNVLKDMIYLDFKGRQKEYMVGSESIPTSTTQK